MVSCNSKSQASPAKRRHRLAPALLNASALVVISAALAVEGPALASSATWSSTPTTGNWNAAGNWTPNTIPNGPNDIATFGTSSITGLSLSANTEVNGITYNAGASPYTITTGAGLLMTISGAGIVNNSGATQILAITNNLPSTKPLSGQVLFTNGATAANLTINNTGIDFSTYTAAGFRPNEALRFAGSSSAANAIINNSGTLATATNNGTPYSYYITGNIGFSGNATASSSTIVNTNSARINFFDATTAGTAKISLLSGTLTFDNNSTAGMSSVTVSGLAVAPGPTNPNTSGGSVEFGGSSTAGSATFVVNGGSTAVSGGTPTAGDIEFRSNSNAGSASFTTNGTNTSGGEGGLTEFQDTASAGTGSFVNNGATATGAIGGGRLRVSGASFSYGGATAFYDTATASSATFTNNGSTVAGEYGGGTAFADSSTAASSTITSNGSSLTGAFGGATLFIANSTAGNATLIANAGSNGGGGGAIVFAESTTGGTATVKIFGNGGLDISPHSPASAFVPVMTIGSVEGSGVVLLGANTLNVGSNNASTVFSGTIMNGGLFGGKGGSLVKIGTGTLTLSGTNLYTGTTTVTAGTLQFGAGGTTGSVLGNVVDNAILAFNRSDNLTYSSPITGTGGVSQIGPGILTLSGANTYQGATTITGGTLRIGAMGALPSGSAVTIAGGATLDLNNLNQTIASLAGAGSLSLGTAILTTGGNNSSSAFSGVISGSGGLTKVGTGTFTLTGANTFSGGLTVSTGVLSAAAASLGTGTVTDNAALIINQTADGSFAGALNGTGTLSKQGAGALNYTGTGTLSGVTTVAAGLFSVNGSLKNSAFSLLGGATLGGIGVIGGLTAPSGSTVSPGNSVGLLSVNGNVAFASGSTYKVEIDPAGNNDKIAATGQTTLSGGAVQAIGAPAVLSVSSTALQIVPDGGGRTGVVQTLASSNPIRFTILTSTGGVSGTFTSVSSDQPTLTPTLSYDATNVFLTLTPQLVTSQSQQLTPNEFAAGIAVLGLPTAAPLYTAAKGLSVSNAAAAFDVTSGEIHASAITDEFEATNLVGDTLLAHMRWPDNVAPGGHVSVWSSGLADFGHTDQNGNAARLTRETEGFIIGVDMPVGETLQIGVAGGYTDTRIRVPDRLSRGTSEEGFGSVYLRAAFGPWRARIGGLYAESNQSIRREVNFTGYGEHEFAGYGGSTLQGFGELGYRIEFKNLNLEPFVGGSAIRIDRDAFTESGAASALTSRGRSYNFETATAGLNLDARIAGTLTVQGTLGYRHVFETTTPDAALSFVAGGPQFAVQGAAIDEDAGVVRASLIDEIRPGLSVELSYNGQFGGGGQDNSVIGNLSWRF